MAWELHVKRLGQQHRPGSRVRTYGTYQVVIDGVPDASMSGHICESEGLGDNSLAGKDTKRIKQGQYALSTQFGPHFHSVGFTNNQTHPMPGFLVLGTEPRDGVLVHPAHEHTLYLSSVGCLNPTKALKAADDMVFADSRARVIAMLNSLKAHDPNAFAHVGTNTPIKEAFIVIEGEPMGPVPADAVA